MSPYLAIDGGNSKTDVVVGNTDGAVLAYVRGPGTCYQVIGMPLALSRLSSLVAQARADAGFPGTFARADVFLAGADLPVEVSLLRDTLAPLGWSDQLRVDNDTFALLRAGTDLPDAVAVVCGAGINCVGRTGDGRVARFPALGPISGDWGGGEYLASMALWHAARGEDGRGPSTDLTAAVALHFGLSTVDELVTAIHLQRLERSRLSELTPVLFATAEAGDPVARQVVQRQADEIVSMALVAARRLDLLEAPYALVLGGGVLRARQPLLHEAVVSGVLAQSPKAAITVVDAPPVLGAALHALDALSAPAAAHEALRSRLR
jgi:N-acetylglucosamine kinase-like BadF-type ATPase